MTYARLGQRVVERAHERGQLVGDRAGDDQHVDVGGPRRRARRDAGSGRCRSDAATNSTAQQASPTSNTVRVQRRPPVEDEPHRLARSGQRRRQPVRASTKSVSDEQRVARRAVGQVAGDRPGLVDVGLQPVAGASSIAGWARSRPQRLGQPRVVGEVAAQQLAQPSAGRVVGGQREQHRQRADALAQVGARRLAGLGRARDARR